MQKKYARLLLVLLAAAIPGRSRAQILPGTLAAGPVFNVLLTADGSLRTWGDNSYGELGDGTTTQHNSPVQPGSAVTYTQVTAGASHTLALRANGTLWAWGSNADGQLGTAGPAYAYQSTPVQIAAGAAWKQVAAGGYHNMALRADGTLWAWGNNSRGQLGTGNTTNQPTPVQMGAGTTWLSVACGTYHTLAVRADGTLWAWGENTTGQLGDGTATTRLAPTQVGTATTWLAARAGDSFTLALQTNGTLWAWGDNTYGQLGDGGSFNRLVPVQVGAARLWGQVNAGGKNSAAIAADGTLWTWGHNDTGQLADGTTTDRHTPAQVGSATTWVEASYGQYHLLALQADGSVWAAGANGLGQLGDGTSTNFRPNLALVPGVAGLPTRALAAGAAYGLAVRPDGRLLAWGGGDYGQLGDGAQADHPTPTLIGTDRDWVQVTAGNFGHSLAVKANGTLWAWGFNGYGQLGDGTFTQRLVPVQIGTTRLWRQVWAGLQYTLALAADGTLWAWGENTQGKLGIGSSASYVTSPMLVSGNYQWRTVATGSYFSLGVQADGSLWSWGSNSMGQLGSNLVSARNVPGQVEGAASWLSVAAGGGHGLGGQANGTLWSWGSNTYGQLGDGTGISRGSVVRVGAAANWWQPAAGDSYSTALRADGTLWAWGRNDLGQLGDNTTTSRFLPVQEATLGTNWLVSTAGDLFALARPSAGYALASTGFNNRGQLGDGTLATALRYDHALVALPSRQVSASVALSLYPNPTAGVARLHGAEASAPILVFDATGRLVLTTVADAAGQAPLSLPAGLYLVRAGSATLRLSVE